MDIRKGFSCSVARTVKTNTITEAQEMKRIAEELIERFGDKEEYVYYLDSHEYYPGYCIFELDIHMNWRTSANNSHSPGVYIAWSRCDYEAENLIKQIIQQLNKEP